MLERGLLAFLDSGILGPTWDDPRTERYQYGNGHHLDVAEQEVTHGILAKTIASPLSPEATGDGQQK
jgi:hypothetical protein